MKPPSSLLKSTSAICAIGAILTAASANATTLLVSEGFTGASNVNLNTTSADVFNAGIITAGGSANWTGGTSTYKADGSYTNTFTGDFGRRSIHLNLGSYINDSKGTATALYTLTATLSSPSIGAIAFGFSTINNPTTDSTYLSRGNGTFRFNSDDTVSLFSTTTSSVALDVGVNNDFADQRTFSITLDLRNYDALTNNFGLLTFSDSVDGVLATHSFASAGDFGAIFLSSPFTSTAKFDSITLTQIPEPTTALIGSLGLLALFRRRRA